MKGMIMMLTISQKRECLLIVQGQQGKIYRRKEKMANKLAQDKLI
jgi:hypothetical protein